ncbi:MAG: metal ABC transporter substrate-binding protein [Alphaproteobacteria bacterium]|nr:metal ABC transporter substrate-binding protein [Alphaproteobacteria bacterium]
MFSRRNVLLLAGLSIAAAGPAVAQDKAPEKVKVVATFSILADFVRNVGGDRVEVSSLVGPDGDAHVFSPTPADARTVGAAKVVFVNGLGFEGWMTRLVRASGTKAPTVVVTKGVKTRKMDGKQAGHSHGHSHGATDPHAWQSIANAKIYVTNIRDGLSKADPAGKEVYASNASAYIARLDALEREVREAVAKIPADRRRIVTTHDSFGYFGDAYGIEFVSPGISTESAPSAKEIAGLIARIKKQKIPAVFLENITDPRLMQQIAKETGARIGGSLYSDALSEPTGSAGTYIDMMRSNIRELSLALTS